MTDWSEGYVSEIEYTHGYYTELNPTRISLSFATAGLQAPKIESACELGFGQGLTVNIHAAASGVQWFGTDFNPSQAGYAQGLAHMAGSGAMLYDDSFAEFANRPDLLDFDFIALHGIWSWISPENQQTVVDFIRRKLKVGGVLYLSYNTQPGWADFAPMRHLLAEYANQMAAKGVGVLKRMDDAMAFAEKVLGNSARYVARNPGVVDRLNGLKEKDRHYLAHEYLNANWHPLYFADIVHQLQPAKLDYACSATLSDLVNSVSLTKEQQSFLGGISDPMFRETVRDYLITQQFRRDYWVKGARRLTAFEQVEALRKLRVILTTPRSDIPLKAKGTLGEATLLPEIYDPVLDALADYQILSVQELESRLAPHGVKFVYIHEAVILLANEGHLALVQDDEAIAQAAIRTRQLNTELMQQARSRSDVNVLASPVTGGGVTVGRIQQLFLLARQEGYHQPKEWVDYTWTLLSAQSQKLLKEGKALETTEENLAELTVLAKTLNDKHLPILKALQIA